MPKTNCEPSVEGTFSNRYPTPWELHGLLTNGQAVFIRPIRTDDIEKLGTFHASLSPETIRRRFFGPHPELLKAEASHFSAVDYRHRMGALAFVHNEIIGYASYEGLADLNTAEVAFVVSDAYQRHGVGTLLFEYLAAYARDEGIIEFIADVLPENATMLDVFMSSGLGFTEQRLNGEVQVVLNLTISEQYRQQCDNREAIAEVASMSAILKPRSIAVVGAGRRPTSIGHRILRSLLTGDFTGTVYPVNPSARSICGVAAYPTLSALPETADLAIVAVPAATVPAILTEAANNNVRASVVITAGFGETGDAGKAVEAGLLDMARRQGMRIVGPNCLGVMNTDPEIALNATFADLDPTPGHLALATQSGAVGIVLAEQAHAAGLGLSNFVSMGNKLDVSSNDLLCFFEADNRTSVIALYLESFGNPRKFARIAGRVAQNKPIVALKAGKTPAGARGARSHTAAAATPEVAVTALLKTAGVIKVDRLEELLDVSSVLLTGTLPEGRRVALVGNSGGPLILAADACELSGLTIPELTVETRNAISKIVVPAAAVNNPIDLTADGTPADLEAVLDIILADAWIDAVIVVTTDLPALSTNDAVISAANIAKNSRKPLVACVLGPPNSAGSARGRLPIIASPERAASALAYVCSYAEWRKSNHQVEAISTPIDARVREIISSELSKREEGGWLSLDRAAQLLRAGGVPVVPTQPATSAPDAAAVAKSLGYPVVLKARSGELVHKSDVGAVVTRLQGPDEVIAAYETMEHQLGSSMGGAIIQTMIKPSVEAIVGISRDRNFGPIVMAGLGGVMTDLLSDRSFGVPPISPTEAATMVSSLRAAKLLDGYRGTPRVDRAALVQLIELLAHLADEIPELAEVDLNPVIIGPSGLVAVDCKVRLAPRTDGPGPLFRSLHPFFVPDSVPSSV